MTGLDSTLAREQEISIVSECDVEVSSKIQEIDFDTSHSARLLHITYTLPAWKAIPLAPQLDLEATG